MPSDFPQRAAVRQPGLRRRRMSAPVQRYAPPRLPPCRPLPVSLDALDLSPASPAQALASLRFLMLSYLAHLENRLSSLETKDAREWASTALDMLHAIRADVCSHLPDIDLKSHLPDMDLKSHFPDMDDLKSHLPDIDLTSHLPDIDLKSHLRDLDLRLPDMDFDFDFDFHLPEMHLPDMRLPDIDLAALAARWHDLDISSYVPTLSARLRGLHAHLAAFDITAQALAPPALANFLVEVDAFLGELPRPSLPRALSSGINMLPSADEEADIRRALALSADGTGLITYTDLPVAWQNNPFVIHGYRFIPLHRPHLLFLSVFRLHNETLNIHTHLLPLVVWGAAFALSSGEESGRDGAEVLFTLFALACLASSALWHTMSGCAHRDSMETCARIDYVGIGWLIATSIATIVHHGYACAEAAYHPVGGACLALCFVCGVSGNILPFCQWFNRVENRLWRLGFFVGISFSALAPLAGIAAMQGWGTMLRFVSPIGSSLLFYIVGLVIYAAQVPECLLSPRVQRAFDAVGMGSHAVWHVCIVLAMRAHREGIREMGRRAGVAGCAVGGLGGG
ncbi:hemolysin-III related-domain-containing protein [Mycena belliarum]|uniref:Hemolysin-III related-domain-containing protein n=1 Tax=Mycena belliarum TaxID=1033014 RepID=A0AAD6U6C1_9AGAR|nr:hemolysin-III related-domain-containing protein [Mycena belliae]